MSVKSMLKTLRDLQGVSLIMMINESGANDIQPTFDVLEAEEYFTSVYHPDPHVYSSPSWLPNAPGLLMRIHLLWKSCHMKV